MKLSRFVVAGLAAGVACQIALRADERRFTYVYEPETLPAGAWEYENWVTLGAGRGASVGQENYRRWDLRQELETGVTDWYTAALYFNESVENYREPTSGANQSTLTWEGVSLENRFNVLNPASHAVGLTLYLEGRYAGSEAALEQKIILGQRHGEWKWAFNLGQETEWVDNLSQVEGEVSATFGIARDLGKHWALGLELRNENLFPRYESWESSVLFLGPVLSYRRENWWAAFTVLPQIYGWNRAGTQDGSSHLQLTDHERISLRLLFGIDL